MGFCKLACGTIIEFIIQLLIYIGCIISIIFAYDHLAGLSPFVSSSLYVIAIPFYVYIIGYILYPIMTCYNDRKEHSVTIDELFCSVYILKMISTIIKRAFYSGLFFVTLYLLNSYDQNNIDQNYQVSRYLYALSIYVLLTWVREWFGSFVEWMYMDGKLYYGNNIDDGIDKKIVEKSKLFRIYFIQRSSNGIEMTVNHTKINYTTLFDPIRACFGMALFIISQSLTKNNSLILMEDMEFSVNIVQIGILTSLCINTLLMIIFTCTFGKNMKMFLFGFYALMIGANLNYLFSSYFYKGFMEYVNGITEVPDFIYYIIGIIIYHIITISIFKIITLCAIKAATNNNFFV